jgi:hypothetical protein
VHVRNGRAHRILRAGTGEQVAEECCASFGLAFSQTTNRRFVSRLGPSGSQPGSVSAYPDEPATAAVWTTEFPDHAGITNLEADDHLVTFLASRLSGASYISEVVVLDAATGVELARRSIDDLAAGAAPGIRFPTAGGLARHGAKLLLSLDGTLDAFLSRRLYLLVLSLPALAREGVIERVPDWSNTEARDVMISADGSTAFWMSWASVMGVTVSSTHYDVVDLATNRLLPGGWISSQIPRSVSLEPSPPCVFDVEPSFDVPSSGGLVELPVRPGADCLSAWTAGFDTGDGARVLNPGPHLGTARVHVALPANTTFHATTRYLAIGGHPVRLRQAVETIPPAPPWLSGMVENGRIRIEWVAGPGPAPHTFVVRGGPRGGDVNTIATVTGESTTWTSPAVPAGSYSVEVVARNAAGDSTPSNRVDMSLGVAALPEAPVLTAVTSDDTVRLSWQPSATGPAPEAYVIEAAAVGSSTFATVARVARQEFVAISVPAGGWQVRVKALTSGGAGPPSNVVALNVSPCSVPPGAPSGLSRLVSGRRVTLQWTHASPAGPTASIIEVGSAAGLVDIGRFAVAGAIASYSVTSPRGLYFVRVRARNACGESAASNEAVVFVP